MGKKEQESAVKKEQLGRALEYIKDLNAAYDFAINNDFLFTKNVWEPKYNVQREEYGDLLEPVIEAYDDITTLFDNDEQELSKMLKNYTQISYEPVAKTVKKEEERKLRKEITRILDNLE